MMPRICKLLASGMVLFTVCKAYSETDAAIEPGILIPNIGTYVDGARFLTPELDDWNNDGKIDILTGTVSDSGRCYYNEGTATSYKFSTTYGGLAKSAFD